MYDFHVILSWVSDTTLFAWHYRVASISSHDNINWPSEVDDVSCLKRKIYIYTVLWFMNEELLPWEFKCPDICLTDHKPHNCMLNLSSVSSSIYNVIILMKYGPYGSWDVKIATWVLKLWLLQCSISTSELFQFSHIYVVWG